MKNWKFPLGTGVSFDRRYTKVGWVNPESDDKRITVNEISGRVSLPRWEEKRLEKPVDGIVVGTRKITLANWVHWYRDWETDRKSTRLNSSHSAKSRMPSSA